MLAVCHYSRSSSTSSFVAAFCVIFILAVVRANPIATYAGRLAKTLLASMQCRIGELKAGGCDLENEPRCGQPSELDNKTLLRPMQSSPTMHEMKAILCCNYCTAVRHSAALENVSELGSWVPRQLSQRNRNFTSETDVQLLSSHQTTSWLDSSVTVLSMPVLSRTDSGLTKGNSQKARPNHQCTRRK